jgi:hypothetical protein
MKLNTGLGPLQWCVVGATLCVAIGMGAANAIGWVLSYGEPWGYPLAALAIGGEVIAVLVLSAGIDSSRARARVLIVVLCGVLNVYGGHQFLDLRERDEQARRAVAVERRAIVSRALQSAEDCISSNRVASRSNTLNASRERLLDQCRSARTEALVELETLPVILSEPAKKPWVLWGLMIVAEVIKALAVYSVASPAPIAGGAGQVVDISRAASLLARKRHARAV